MNAPPVRPLSFIPPLLIGIFSLLGLCAILALAFRPQESAELIPTRTSTPFKYQLLATETLIPATSLASETAEFRSPPTETDLVTVMVTEEPFAQTTPFLPATRQNTRITTASAFTPTSTLTLQPGFGTSDPIETGKYDDRDPRFNFIGVWTAEENSYAYQETVLVSEEVGDYVAFRFEGLQLMFGYQSSDDSGEFTVSIDGLEETMTQVGGSIWFSDYLDEGTHQAIITHTGAGPVNVDFIEIAQ